MLILKCVCAELTHVSVKNTKKTKTLFLKPTSVDTILNE